MVPPCVHVVLFEHQKEPIYLHSEGVACPIEPLLLRSSITPPSKLDWICH